MSLLSSITNPIVQAANDYQTRASDRWARKVVSTLPANVQNIFNIIAKDQIVQGFDRERSFYESAGGSNVAVLKTRNEISVRFYVGGFSDKTIEVIDWQSPFIGKQTSVLKIRDVVSAVFIKGSSLWEVNDTTLRSDFAKCIATIEGEGAPPLEKDFDNSFALLEEIVDGTHSDFGVISKEDFEKRNYMVADIRIDDFHTEPGSSLVIYGNGIGMDNWTKAIPLQRQSYSPNDYWCATIRGNKETGEYKLALLKADGSILLEAGEYRKFKDLTNFNTHNLYPINLEDFKNLSPSDLEKT